MTLYGATAQSATSGVLGTAVVRADTTWTLVPRVLGDGTWAVRATQTDPVGNVSRTSDQVLVDIDTVAPAPPVITSPTPDGVVRGPAVKVSGRGEPGALVVVDGQDGVVFGPTSVTASGIWSLAIRAGTGTRGVVTALQTDPAGNTSAATNPVGYDLDIDIPIAPVIQTPVDGATGRTTPVIAGTGTAGGRVQVFVDAALVGTATVRTDSTWALTPRAMTAGPHTVIVFETDVRGIESADSAAVTFVVDETVPGSPTITGPVEQAAVAQRQPAVFGTAEPGATVVVSLDGTDLPGVPVAGNGRWATRPLTPLAEGPHVLSAQQSDPTGNVSAAGAATRFTVDLRLRPVLRPGRPPYAAGTPVPLEPRARPEIRRSQR